ncbi:hypothetical protein QAD02_002446 [Eretmocerus hayati]|uniref:Uncharacterized protein n=1 Tax=Eretmocerus hayati TaxID=131215 RepID=A0ACC2NLT7_9HYME|nr:hypothetical protein QAD02_002446 [Eretmocerus hayati]
MASALDTAKAKYSQLLSEYSGFRGSELGDLDIEKAKTLRKDFKTYIHDVLYLLKTHINSYPPGTKANLEVILNGCRELKNPEPLQMSKLEEENLKSAILCHICQGVLLNDRVRDHCHISGSYRGPSHSKCNLNFRKQYNIVTLSHNLSRYDMNFLISDVIDVCDIFEKFRETCLESYELDPVLYFTLPGSSWDALLKKLREEGKVKLEKLTDIDQILSIELGIRGGLSVASHHYAVANNPYMKNYDPSKDESYIMYYDMNNLYGSAMLSKSPHGDFKWVEVVDNFNLQDIDDKSDIGYILEVDISYAHTLHELHSDYPSCPEEIIPPNSDEQLLEFLYHNEYRLQEKIYFEIREKFIY